MPLPPSTPTPEEGLALEQQAIALEGERGQRVSSEEESVSSEQESDKAPPKKKGRVKGPPLPLDEDWMRASLFTFSSKAVNSNAAPVGVRPHVDVDQVPPGYVCATSLLLEGVSIPLDYVGDAGTHAGRFKMLRQALGEVEGVPADPALTAPYHALSHAPKEKGTEIAPLRLVQLKVPVTFSPEEDLFLYRVISPLTSGGLARLMNEARARLKTRYFEALKEKKAFPFYQEACADAFPVGGSNPQNIGGHTYALHHPLVLHRLPSTHPSVKYAFRIKYQGVTWHLPSSTTRAYLNAYLHRLSQGHASTTKKEEKELQHLHALVTFRQTAAAQLSASLLATREVWDSAAEARADLEESLSSHDKGWLFPDTRTRAWREEAAQYLTHEITHYVLEKREERNITAHMVDHDKRSLFKQIQALLEERV